MLVGLRGFRARVVVGGVLWGVLVVMVVFSLVLAVVVPVGEMVGDSFVLIVSEDYVVLLVE